MTYQTKGVALSTLWCSEMTYPILFGQVVAKSGTFAKALHRCQHVITRPWRACWHVRWRQHVTARSKQRMVKVEHLLRYPLVTPGGPQASHRCWRWQCHLWRPGRPPISLATPPTTHCFCLIEAWESFNNEVKQQGCLLRIASSDQKRIREVAATSSIELNPPYRILSSVGRSVIPPLVWMNWHRPAQVRSSCHRQESMVGLQLHLLSA